MLSLPAKSSRSTSVVSSSRATIPRKANEHRSAPFDRVLYRLRHKVECLINRCTQYRSLATRYEKRAESYRAFWVIALTMLWL